MTDHLVCVGLMQEVEILENILLLTFLGLSVLRSYCFHYRLQGRLTLHTDLPEG